MKKRTSTPPSLSPAPSRKNLHSLSASPREIPCSAFTGISCASINPVRSISPASSLSTSTNTSACLLPIPRAITISCTSTSFATSTYSSATSTSRTAASAAITMLIVRPTSRRFAPRAASTSSLASRMRLKVLSRETLDDNSKFFGPGEEGPRCAITMGIGTILEARKILLLATGASKAAAIAKSIEGPITCAVSASALQLHPDVTFVLDEPAAAQLAERDYYHRVLQMTALLTPDRL